jgi:glycosyltransferase involved in cell wall biosynthesis
MSARALVSVITPVYNGAEYLAECIGSVRCQTYPNWEHIVLDNGSTDETAAVAEASAAGDARIRVVRAREFVGLYANHNRALREIAPESRYVKFVHADDWLYPECLERMVAVAEGNPGVGVVSAFRMEGERVLHDGLVPYTQQVMPGPEVVRRGLVDGLWVTGSPTSLLIRSDWTRADPAFFDETMWHADTDAAYRILMDSELGFVHQVLTFTRVHEGALTPRSKRMETYIPEDLRMLARYGPSLLPRDECRALLRRRLALYLWYLSKQAMRPSQRGDERFHEFHRREIGLLRGEVGDDRRARRLLRLCGALLRHPGGADDEGLPGSAVELGRDADEGAHPSSPDGPPATFFR